MLETVEFLDCLVGFGGIRHFDKTETARAAGVTIADHDRFADLAVNGERIAQAFVVRVPAQTSNKQFLRHISLLSPWALPFRGAPLSQPWWTLRPLKQKPAPLAGNIFKINVTVGQSVNSGDVVMIMEAMKMETEVRATRAGTVSSLTVKEGDAVQVGDTLMVLG